jgi:hypothetical protein
MTGCLQSNLGKQHRKGRSPNACHTFATIVLYQLSMTFSMGDLAAIGVLVGFLGLIGGMLVSWSSDRSAKERR